MSRWSQLVKVLTLAWLASACGVSRLHERTEPFRKELNEKPGTRQSPPERRLDTRWDGATLIAEVYSIRQCHRWMDVTVETGRITRRSTTGVAQDVGLGLAGLAVGGLVVGHGTGLSDKKPTEDESSPQGTAYFWGGALLIAGASMLIKGVYNKARESDSKQGVRRETIRRGETQRRCDKRPSDGQTVTVTVGGERATVGTTTPDGLARIDSRSMSKALRQVIARAGPGAQARVTTAALAATVDVKPWYDHLHGRALDRTRQRDSIAAWEQFLSVFEGSNASEEAHRRLATLRWQTIADSERSEQLLAFAQAHPGRPEADLARARAARVDYAQLGKAPTIDALEGYAARHGARSVPEAQKALAARRLEAARQKLRSARTAAALHAIYTKASDPTLRTAAREKARRLSARRVRQIRRAQSIIDNGQLSHYNAYICDVRQGVVHYRTQLTGWGAAGALAMGMNEHFKRLKQAEASAAAAFRKYVPGVRGARRHTRCALPWFM